MTRLNVLRAMGTGWGSAHAREPEENPGNKQIRRQLGESVRQSLPGPDAPPRGRGGWVGEGTGSCSSPDPLLLMLGRQWQSWAARTCRSSPAICVAPGGRGTCQPLAARTFQNKLVLPWLHRGHASGFSLTHPLCIHWHRLVHRETLSLGRHPLPLSPWYTPTCPLPPPYCRVWMPHVSGIT